MGRSPFRTEDGQHVPAVTAEQIREVGRIAMADFGVGVLQRMEHAGRNLALNVRDMMGEAREVTIPAVAVVRGLWDSQQTGGTAPAILSPQG